MSLFLLLFLILSGRGPSLFVFASLVIGVQYDPINIKIWIRIRENIILVIYLQKPRHAVMTFVIKSQRPAWQGQVREVVKDSSVCTSLATNSRVPLGFWMLVACPIRFRKSHIPDYIILCLEPQWAMIMICLDLSDPYSHKNARSLLCKLYSQISGQHDSDF